MIMKGSFSPMQSDGHTRVREVTAKRVAELSGVSVSTVSRVLSGSNAGAQVKAETRERVLEIANKLNYRPSPMLRTIRAKTTNLVAIVGLRDVGRAIRGPTENAVMALTDTLGEHGLDLCTNLLSPRIDPFELPRWRVDGAVLLDCPDAETAEAIEASGLPYVAINGASGPRGCSVRARDDEGARTLVHHFVRLGHKSIAYIPRDPACQAKSLRQAEHERGVPLHDSVLRRHEGYLAALDECRLGPVTPELPAESSAYESLRRVVFDHDATGLIVYDHMTAVRIMHAAKTLSLRIPEDVSLACFNDLFPCEDVVPSLTAMSLPAEQMGREAARLLIERLRDPSLEPEHLTWAETLVIRESTAPPRRHSLAR